MWELKLNYFGTKIKLFWRTKIELFHRILSENRYFIDSIYFGGKYFLSKGSCDKIVKVRDAQGGITTN